MNHSHTLLNRIWNVFLFILLVIFMLLSMNSILPLKWQFPSWRLSPHLTVKTEKTADGIRTDYVNSKGVITVALDKNYASVIKTYDQEGNCILERYFDDHGRPALLSAGHSALRKEYNSNGQWISTTYLDGSLNPVVINRGYASVHRTYTKSDKVETEMYFDADGLPTLDVYKEYGVRHEYNEDDHESAVINIDATGNAMDNSSHYAISKTTYTSDGKIVMYYNKDGTPAKLSYGHSGYLYKKDKSICVDQDGRKMFVLRYFLYNSILAVLIIGILLLLLILLSNLPMACILLFLYLAFIAYMTIMDRETGIGAVTWNIPLNYYLFFINRSMLANIWLFIPFGAILYKLSHIWEIIAFPILLSLLIETSQLVLDIGAFEISDLITNSLGGIVGIIICYLLEPIAKRIWDSIKKRSPVV